MAQGQHPSSYAPGPSVPVSFASSSQIRGKMRQDCFAVNVYSGTVKFWVMCHSDMTYIFYHIHDKKNCIRQEETGNEGVK